MAWHPQFPSPSGGDRRFLRESPVGNNSHPLYHGQQANQYQLPGMEGVWEVNQQGSGNDDKYVWDDLGGQE